MKILIASDLHYRLKQFDWLEKVASDYDAMIIAGDLLDISSHLDLNVQIVVISKYLKRISQKTRLLVCSGNHDGNEKNDNDEFIAPWLQKVRDSDLHVDGDNIYFEKTLITIFPWWDGEVTKNAVSEQFSMARQMQPEFSRWVWIYHAPPDNSPTSWNGNRFFGDRELNHWIDKYHPDIVISGHIHESPFKPAGSWIDKIGNTWVLNAGNYISDIPPYIILDLEGMTAEWHSLAGDGKKELDGLKI